MVGPVVGCRTEVRIDTWHSELCGCVKSWQLHTALATDNLQFEGFRSPSLVECDGFLTKGQKVASSNLRPSLIDVHAGERVTLRETQSTSDKISTLNCLAGSGIHPY